MLKKPLTLGILMIIAGIWLKAHYDPVVQLCNSGFGGFAQALSSSATENCSSAQNAVDAAPWSIGIGIALVAGNLLMMAGLFGALAADRRKKRQTEA